MDELKFIRRKGGVPEPSCPVSQHQQARLLNDPGSPLQPHTRDSEREDSLPEQAVFFAASDQAIADDENSQKRKLQHMQQNVH